MYQNQSFSQQMNENQLHLQDEDYGNFVLFELKRCAREYATAALEAANPQIRQAFQNLLNRTMEDQATVFEELQKLGAYPVPQATQERILEELQTQSQAASKLQNLVQQHLSASTASAGRSTVAQARSMQQSYAANSQLSQRIEQEAEQSYTYVPEQVMSEESSSSMLHTSGASMMNQHQNHNQNQHQYQNQNQNQQYQQPSHNRMQAMGQAQIQPMINTSQYPNATHQSGQQQGYAQGQSHAQANAQTHTYTTSYTQPAGYGSTTGSFGREQSGYAASSQGGSDAQMGRGPGARIVSRTQPGMQAQGRTDSSYTTRQQPGGKYSF